MAGGVCWHAVGHLGIKGEKTPLFGCDLNNVMIKTLLRYTTAQIKHSKKAIFYTANLFGLLIMVEGPLGHILTIFRNFMQPGTPQKSNILSLLNDWFAQISGDETSRIWKGVSQNDVFETIHRLSGEYIWLKPRKITHDPFEDFPENWRKKGGKIVSCRSMEKFVYWTNITSIINHQGMSIAVDEKRLHCLDYVKILVGVRSWGKAWVEPSVLNILLKSSKGWELR